MRASRAPGMPPKRVAFGKTTTARPPGEERAAAAPEKKTAAAAATPEKAAPTKEASVAKWNTLEVRKHD